ncbi:MAG: DUF4258 domain-containing protein [Methylococcaceae bacterium]|nr:DUF4258 domain-containing protein [Methylococcaceae bacterium]
MDSLRFDRPIHITRHAKERMAERGISEDLLFDLVETGTTKQKDDTRIWIFKAYPGRGDNLICAAAVLEDYLIIKTVMHHFQLEEI